MIVSHTSTPPVMTVDCGCMCSGTHEAIARTSITKSTLSYKIHLTVKTRLCHKYPQYHLRNAVFLLFESIFVFRFALKPVGKGRVLRSRSPLCAIPRRRGAYTVHLAKLFQNVSSGYISDVSPGFFSYSAYLAFFSRSNLHRSIIL